MPQNGFQEGSSAVISQNMGAGKPKRALKAFGCVLAVNVFIGAILMSCCLLFLHPITTLFTGNDKDFGEMIANIYRYEALGAIPLGINASVLALLYGFGKTKITLTINFFRVFVFRIPVLWFLQNMTNVGSTSMGLVMAISNIATGIFSFIICLMEIRKICRQYQITFFIFKNNKHTEIVQHSS